MAFGQKPLRPREATARLSTGDRLAAIDDAREAVVGAKERLPAVRAAGDLRALTRPEDRRYAWRRWKTLQFFVLLVLVANIACTLRVIDLTTPLCLHRYGVALIHVIRGVGPGRHHLRSEARANVTRRGPVRHLAALSPKTARLGARRSPQSATFPAHPAPAYAGMVARAAAWRIPQSGASRRYQA